MKAHTQDTTATGGCLCGAVRYTISGELRKVINCHCSKCRRFHGHFGAYTSVDAKALTLVKEDGLRWYHSTQDETPGVRRGFCHLCGSSLFWHPHGWERISIAAGSLDEPTTLKTIGHIWMEQVGDYYSIDDGLPQYQQRWGDDSVS